MTLDAGVFLAQPMGCESGHSARSMSSAAAGEPGWALAGIADAAREGDQHAFAELYQRLAPGIFDHILVMVGDRGTAEDILQQTFLDAWRGLATLREPDRVRGWLHGIARHLPGPPAVALRRGRAPRGCAGAREPGTWTGNPGDLR